MRVRARFLGRCIIDDQRHFNVALGPPPRHYRTGGRQRHCRALGGCGGSTPVLGGFPPFYFLAAFFRFDFFVNGEFCFHRRSLRWMFPLYLFAQFLGANELRRFFEFFHWFFLCFQHFFVLMLRLCLRSFVHCFPIWQNSLVTHDRTMYFPTNFLFAVAVLQGGGVHFSVPNCWFITLPWEDFLMI